MDRLRGPERIRSRQSLAVGANLACAGAIFFFWRFLLDIRFGVVGGTYGFALESVAVSLLMLEIELAGSDGRSVGLLGQDGGSAEALGERELVIVHGGVEENEGRGGVFVGAAVALGRAFVLDVTEGAGEFRVFVLPVVVGASVRTVGAGRGGDGLAAGERGKDLILQRRQVVGAVEFIDDSGRCELSAHVRLRVPDSAHSVAGGWVRRSDQTVMRFAITWS